MLALIGYIVQPCLVLRLNIFCPFEGNLVACCGWVRGLIRRHKRSLVAEMDPLNPSRIERYRQGLGDEETPEPEPLEAQELHDVWQQGNRRRPVPPKLSDRHKADLVDLKRRWITFAAKMGCRDWKGLIKTLSYENKGLGESFMRYLMRQAELQGNPIRSENAIHVHTRKLSGLYRKYNAHPPERSLMDHLRNVIRSEITCKWALRREPKIKPIMGPDFFMYHLYFLWVRDTSAFHIGLDRIDDVPSDVLHVDRLSKTRADLREADKT